MKKLRKKSFLVCLLVLMALTLKMPVYAEAAGTTEEEITLTVHYHRYDESYAGWNLWLWPSGGDGKAYQFEDKDDFGKYLTVTIPQGSPDEMGLIVRLNDWQAKDIDRDRFIDLGRAADGKLDVYLVQGVEEILYDASEVDLSPKFLSASVTEEGNVKYSTSAPISVSKDGEKEKYIITDETGKQYLIADIKVDAKGLSTSATIIMGESMTASHSYTLQHEKFGAAAIALNGLYSTAEFEEAYTYTGNDLGAVYSKESTAFRVWAPTAESVNIRFYSEGSGDNMTGTVAMERAENGTYTAVVEGDLNGVYYTYELHFGGVVNEAVDPYARTTGVNGQRAMVIDLDSTDPEGWDKDEAPQLGNATDAVLYELHVRDLSMDENSNIVNKGKYLAFTENGTKNADGMATGIDHIVELGATHVHLLPVYDFASVDESAAETSFNWGYDPQNYNVPEGSYSTDPYHGEVRVNEFKQMVQAMHSNGLRVVMDVVYNHTYNTDSSPFNLTVPQYFYRMNGDNYANGSGCGNEVASERSMVRKYIVDSVTYWATEYHIDGFRFDLMGLIDIETMNAVRAALNEINPDIIVYGEGWNAGSCQLEDSDAALKKNTYLMDSGIAVFSDDMRDGLKGSVFSTTSKGFVSGSDGKTERIKFGIVAATDYKALDYGKIDSADSFWAGAPTQCINYAACHDNNTLWDRLAISNKTDTISLRKKMNRLSAAIVLTSQGIPFIHSGEEICRSKVNPNSSTGYDENSYKSSDAVNSLKWAEKTSHRDMFDYYKGLIAFRKAHPALRLTTTDAVNSYLSFLDTGYDNVIAYTLAGEADGEGGRDIFAAFNAESEEIKLTLPEGSWDMYVDGERAGTEILGNVSNEITLDAVSAVVLVKSADAVKEQDDKADTSDVTAEIPDKGQPDSDSGKTSDDSAKTKDSSDTETDDSNWPLIIAVAAVVVLAGGFFGYRSVMKKNR